MDDKTLAVLQEDVEKAQARFAEAWAALLNAVAEKLEEALVKPAPNDNEEAWGNDDDEDDLDLGDDGDDDDDDDNDEDEEETEFVNQTFKFQIGDTVSCPTCGEGKVLKRTTIYGRPFYTIEGLGEHSGTFLTLVKKAQPKYSVGQFVKTFSSEVEILTVDANSIEVAYGVRYPGGLKSVRLERELGEVVSMPTPYFRAGERVVMEDDDAKHGYIVSVEMTEDMGSGMRNYKFHIRWDGGNEIDLYDFDLSRDNSPFTAHNIIEREN